jgi:hypothetical protein
MVSTPNHFFGGAVLNLRCILTILLLVTFVAPTVSHAATPEQVEHAIEKAKGWLYSKQENGHWDNEPPPQKDQRGGMTAFVVYTLLAMGENSQDDRLKQAIDWMLKNESDGTYAISLRCQVWNLMPQTDAVRAALKKDVAKLSFTTGPGRTAGVRGLYSYEYNNQSNADPSTSQYGALGMWAATQAGIEVPTAYWEQVDKQWRKLQEPGGGWSYQGEPGDDGKIRASMTAAGIATLYITQDQLSAGKPPLCRGNIRDPHIDRAMKWTTDHWDKAINKGGYGLYTIERMGLASGRKYIGTHDWYQEGADRILKAQAADGSFPNQVPWLAETCFKVLFLVRGRAPIVMSKLEYSLANEGGGAAAARRRRKSPTGTSGRATSPMPFSGSASRPSVTWPGRLPTSMRPSKNCSTRRSFTSPETRRLKFSDADVAKLKAYVEAGGLILGNADCANDAFSTSFKALGTKMCGYEFRTLPESHVLYTGEMFPRDEVENQAGLSSDEQRRARADAAAPIDGRIQGVVPERIQNAGLVLFADRQSLSVHHGTAKPSPARPDILDHARRVGQNAGDRPRRTACV